VRVIRACAALFAAATCVVAPTTAKGVDSPGAVKSTGVAGGLPSPDAQRAFASARAKLLQIRTLLRDQPSQSSTGSGFIVDPSGLAITNYHVVSQAALQPDQYRLRYERTGGSGGDLQLLAIDAIQDLALVRLLEPQDTGNEGAGEAHARAPGDWEALQFRAATMALAKGERIYSLGNPLDVGFSVHEGTYSGLAAHSFYPRIFFSGALDPGMSGGPVLDQAGRVVGVNVSTHLMGKQVSFLIPAHFAQELLLRGRDQAPVHETLYPEVSRQLLAHQAALVDRLTREPWRQIEHGQYEIPSPPEDFMRCWGSSSDAENQGLQFQRSQCQMNAPVFVTSRLQIGTVSERHEIYDGSHLGALRFAKSYSKSFENEPMSSGAGRTSPQCKEEFVGEHGLPLRTVICISAYRKLPGLFDFSVLAATVDSSTAGVLGRLDARGVDFENGLRLARHYLDGFTWHTSH
jgi:serine protease Do